MIAHIDYVNVGSFLYSYFRKIGQTFSPVCLTNPSI